MVGGKCVPCPSGCLDCEGDPKRCLRCRLGEGGLDPVSGQCKPCAEPNCYGAGLRGAPSELVRVGVPGLLGCRQPHRCGTPPLRRCLRPPPSRALAAPRCRAIELL